MRGPFFAGVVPRAFDHLVKGAHDHLPTDMAVVDGHVLEPIGDVPVECIGAVRLLEGLVDGRDHDAQALKATPANAHLRITKVAVTTGAGAGVIVAHRLEAIGVPDDHPVDGLLCDGRRRLQIDGREGILYA